MKATPPRWTEAEVIRARELVDSGKSYLEVSDLMGRSAHAIYEKLRLHTPRTSKHAERAAKAKPTLTWRTCLRCRGRFESKGIHNRLCIPCGEFAKECGWL